MMESFLITLHHNWTNIFCPVTFNSKTNSNAFMYSLDVFDHVQAHFDGTFRMVRSSRWQSADTIITIAEQLYSVAMILLWE